jgi:hypothetical protein
LQQLKLYNDFKLSAHRTNAVLRREVSRLLPTLPQRMSYFHQPDPMAGA